MAELVQRLDERKRQPRQQHVMRRAHRGGGVCAQRIPVRAGHGGGQRHQAKPEPEHQRVEQHARHTVEAAQQRRRVAQRHPKRQRVHIRPAALRDAFIAPLRLRRDVGAAAVVEHPLLGQPGQCLDHLVLGRRLVAQVAQQRLPDLLHRVLAVETPHQLVGAVVDAALARRARTDQHIPGLATAVLAAHDHVGAQARRLLRDAVPQRTEQRFAHGAGQLPKDQSASRAQSTSRWVQIHASDCWPASILATPCSPGRKPAGLDSNRASTS